MQEILTRTELEGKKLNDLKVLAAKFKIEPVGDSRLKETWVKALLESQPQKVAEVEIKESTSKKIVRYSGLSTVSCGNGEFLVNNPRDLSVTLKINYADEEGNTYQVQILPNYLQLWTGDSLEGAFAYCVQFFGSEKYDNGVSLIFDGLLPGTNQIAFKAYKDSEFCGLVFNLGLGRWQCGIGDECKTVEECVCRLSNSTRPDVVSSQGWTEVDGLWNFAEGVKVIAQVQIELEDWVIDYNGVRQMQRFKDFELAKSFVEDGYIARKSRVNEVLVVEKHEDNKYVVRNLSNGNFYAVSPDEADPKERCECGDAHFRGAYCKHQMAVDEFIANQKEVSMNYQEGDIVLVRAEDSKNFQRILLVRKINSLGTEFESYTGQMLNIKLNPLNGSIHPVYRCVMKEQVEDLILDKNEVERDLPKLFEPASYCVFLPLDACGAEYEARVGNEVVAKIEHDMFSYADAWEVSTRNDVQILPSQRAAFAYVKKLVNV